MQEETINNKMVKRLLYDAKRDRLLRKERI